MAVVFLVGPHHLSTRQTLIIGRYKVCRPVRKSTKIFQTQNKKRSGNAPSDLLKGDVIKTAQHFHFHLTEGLRMASNTKLKLRCTPVLLDEV